MIEGIRIALHGIVAVDFRSLIVLEIELCQSPVKVWLAQPRLRIDDHIEALNGKNIVLVVQCIASHQQDAVCINLSGQRWKREKEKAEEDKIRYMASQRR